MDARASDGAGTITHNRVLRIAVPIVISNATVPILGAVDTGVVGQMGLAAPIGAVGLGAIVLSAFYWFFGFLRMGTVGLTAQAAGDEDHAEVTALLTRGLLNIALDMWFVLGLGWGVQGVAIATFLAEWSGLAMGLWFCRAAFRTPDWRNWVQVFSRSRWVRMIRLNTDILIRSILLEAIFLSFVFIGSDMGDVTLAANQVLLQFLMITAYGLDGFAFAAEALVGRAVGARQVAALRRSAVLASFWAGVVSVLMTAVFWIVGPQIIDLMAKAPQVQATARVFLPYLLAVPVLACAAFMLDGIFIGATRSRDMRNMMALSFAIFVVAVLVLVPAYGNHGLWAAMLISFVARGITLALRYPALERDVRAAPIKA